MLTHEQVFILRNARRGYRPCDETRELCGELTTAGLLRPTQGLFGWRLRLTDKGRQELQRAALGRDKIGRAIAEGAFDHVSFRLFEQLVASPDAERYLASQQEVQRLILLNRARGQWQ